MIKLGVLDQSPIRRDGTASDAVKETIDLARACESYGYHRYWVAEHHNSKSFAGAAPEILIGALGASTSRIRVGSGGIMMPHYSPLKVAEQFRMLETLYPGRIDLGLGRAPGTDGRTTRALQPGPQAYDISVFPQQVELLIQFLEDANGLSGEAGGFPDEHPYKGIHAMPRGEGNPELWMLGSGGDGAAHAGQFGMPYSFAHFINQDAGTSPVEIYRQCFKPSRRLNRPYVAVGVSVMVADTEEEANRIAASRNHWVVKLLQNQAERFWPVDDALNYPYSDREKAMLKAIEHRSVTGAPEQVRVKLLQMIDEYGADELNILTITHDHADRLRSYKLLADAFSLSGSLAAD